MTPLESLLSAIIYAFILALLDHQITAVLAKHLPPDERFHVYVLIQTMLNQWIAVNQAVSSYATHADLVLAILIYVTYLAAWVGGWVDFLYYAFDGAFPDYNKRWSWMPKIVVKITNRGKLSFEHPTTTHYAVYTLGWTVTIFSCWLVKINWGII